MTAFSLGARARPEGHLGGSERKLMRTLACSCRWSVPLRPRATHRTFPTNQYPRGSQEGPPRPSGLMRRCSQERAGGQQAPAVTSGDPAGSQRQPAVGMGSAKAGRPVPQPRPPHSPQQQEGFLVPQERRRQDPGHPCCEAETLTFQARAVQTAQPPLCALHAGRPAVPECSRTALTVFGTPRPQGS